MWKFWMMCVCITCFSMSAPGGQEFHVEGTIVDACNCSTPCSWEMSGEAKSCERLGAIFFTGGDFLNVDLENARLAYAIEPGSWVRIYVQAVHAVQREAVIAFAKAYFSSYGTVEESREAKIDFQGEEGDYVIKVNDGNLLYLATEAVLGGDEESPIVVQNTKNRLSPMFKQARTVSGRFSDEGRSIHMNGSNASFNDELDTEGEV